jgi:hypothetical protein
MTGTWQMHCWTLAMLQEEAAVQWFLKRVEGFKLFHKYKINIRHWIRPNKSKSMTFHVISTR